jgi:hypothetical protein
MADFRLWRICHLQFKLAELHRCLPTRSTSGARLRPPKRSRPRTACQNRSSQPGQQHPTPCKASSETVPGDLNATRDCRHKSAILQARGHSSAERPSLYLNSCPPNRPQNVTQSLRSSPQALHLASLDYQQPVPPPFLRIFAGNLQNVIGVTIWACFCFPLTTLSVPCSVGKCITA